MLKPAFGPFHQVAWVTNDLDRSLGVFRDVYGVPDFFVFDAEFDATVDGTTGVMKLRLGLANVDGVEFELIEPVGGGVDAIYRDCLPTDGRYGNVFHHICIKIGGSEKDWQDHLAALHPDRPLYYYADPGPGCHFVYTDERKHLGHFIEHVWFSLENAQRMNEVVPRFHTH